jgi:hypothetical protein
MSTLTDRYVWGVLRAVPSAQRADLEPEIRAMVLDAVEARIAAGVVPAEAERAAVAELGDPERLAATYTDRTLFLIGPRLFPDWKRLLTLLLPIVVPIVAVALLAAELIGGAGPLEAVAAGLSGAFTVGVMITFWVTVVFAVMERREIPDFEEELVWTPDRLPELPPARAGVSLVETAFSIAFLAIAASALVWQQTASPVTINGASVPLFNAELWPFWGTWFLVLLGVQILFHFVLYLRGWTLVLAVVNTALNVAFAAPALWLWSEGRLFDPALAAAFVDMGLAEAMRPTAIVIAVVIVAATTWDVIEGYLKSVRAARPW